MSSRLLAAAVVLGTLLSAGLLGFMLAAPLISQPAAVLSLPSQAPEASDAADELPPIGLYVLRGPSSYGVCLGLELTPPSYPVGDGAVSGVATVYWWDPGMTGCTSRSGDVLHADASVERVPREDAPDETLGYTIRFDVPLAADIDVSVELTILAGRSTQDLLQVVDSGEGGGGQGLVFDAVGAIEPILDPIPSPSAEAALQPVGSYLLEGPLTAEGPCFVVDLAEESYPVDATAAGGATVRWWDRAIADPEDPTACLSRSGDVHTVAATIVPVTDESGTPTAYVIQFFLPATESRAGQVIDMSVPLDQSTIDQLHANVATTDGDLPVVLDRVDSIDPPLVTP